MSRIMKHLLPTVLFIALGLECAQAGDQPQAKAETFKEKQTTEEKTKPSRPNSARQILKIADLLESPNAAERERAAAELLLYGEQFLPALRESLQKLSDVDTRRRLQVIVLELEERRMMQPRRVSLKVENKKLSNIFEEVQKQTGYKIQFPEQQGEDNRFSLKLENASFWEAVDKACELGGGGRLNFANFSNRGESQFAVQLMDTHDPHVAYAGPCRLETSFLQTSKNLALGRIPRGKKPVRQPENINLTFQLYTEPKAPISNTGWINAETVKAVDEHGASMIVPGQTNQDDVETSYGNAYWGGNRRMNLSSLNASLFRPGPDSTMIKELRVKAKIPMLTGSREILTVTDPLDAVGKRFQSPDFDFIIEAAKYDNGSFTLKLTAIRKHGGANNLYGLILGMIEVYDSRDRMYSLVQNGEFKSGFNIITMDLTYAGDQFQNDNVKLGKPKKLCFSEPVVVEKQFDFLFKNIPIP